MVANRFFAARYAQAREGFLAAAEAAGAELQAHRHPLRGRDGETLAMDVARLGPADARALLIVSSGCHGVEGFCGSGVQRALLADGALRDDAQDAGVALLLVHALNPYGFSWLRRVTQENVDLNRNWHDFSLPLPRNAAYDEIAHALLPAQWPPAADNEARLARWVATHGERAFQAALSAGQHAHPEGLFYGGVNPTWSHQALRHVLREHATRCSRLGWIDVHTGLGPCGHGERIVACRDEPAALARARAWWGTEVTSIWDGSSSSARLTGLMWNAAYEECAQAEYTGLALEFGTLPLPQVTLALRAEQWLENHPEAPDALATAIKRQFRDAFHVDTPAWKAAVVGQGLQVVAQAVAGLAQDPAAAGG